jgi:hypothetical protein
MHLREERPLDAAAPYRTAPLETGLPLPRRHLRGWSALVSTCGLVALILPLSAVASNARLASAVRTGSGAFALAVVLALLAAPALTLAGALGVRGKPLPLPVLFGLALAPLAAALRAAVLAVDSLADDLREVPPVWMPRILAEALSEVELLALFGCTAAAAGCGVVAVSHAAAVGTLDRARIGARPGPLALSVVLGAAWFGAAFAVRVAFRPDFEGAAWLAAPLALPLVVASVAAALTWTAPVLRDWHDAAEAREMRASIAISALAAGAALVFVHRAALAAGESRALADLAAAQLSLEERSGLVARMVRARDAHLVAGLVDAVGCGLSFLLPLWASRRARAATPSPAIAVAVGATLLAAGALAGVHALADEAKSASVLAATSGRRARLPKVVAPAAPSPRPGSRFVVGPDGVERQGLWPAWREQARPSVLADPAMTFGAFTARVRATGELSRGSLTLIAEPSLGSDLDALGANAVFVMPHEHALDVTIEWLASPERGVPRMPLAVVLDDPPHAHVEGGDQALPITFGGSGDAFVRRAVLARVADGRLPCVWIVPRAHDAMADVVAAVAALDGDLREAGAVFPEVRLVAPRTFPAPRYFLRFGGRMPGGSADGSLPNPPANDPMSMIR